MQGGIAFFCCVFCDFWRDQIAEYFLIYQDKVFAPAGQIDCAICPSSTVRGWVGGPCGAAGSSGAARRSAPQPRRTGQRRPAARPQAVSRQPPAGTYKLARSDLLRRAGAAHVSTSWARHRCDSYAAAAQTHGEHRPARAQPAQRGGGGPRGHRARLHGPARRPRSGRRSGRPAGTKRLFCITRQRRGSTNPSYTTTLVLCRPGLADY